MSFRLFNHTTGHEIIDADSDKDSPYETDSLPEAIEALRRTNELRKLNPKHTEDLISIIHV